MESKRRLFGKYPGAAINEIMLTVFQEIKGPVTMDFFEKRATIKCFYGQLQKVKFTLFIE